MSLHVRVPPEAAAAGLGKPQQVHGPFLPVSSPTAFITTINVTVWAFSWFISFFVSLREFKSEFLELLRRRFGESKYKEDQKDNIKQMPFGQVTILTIYNIRIITMSVKIFGSPPVLAGTKRVHNNIIYNEYISDRQHIHMNATRWETLTEFTKWLGREGKWLRRPRGARMKIRATNSRVILGPCRFM